MQPPRALSWDGQLGCTGITDSSRTPANSFHVFSELRGLGGLPAQRSWPAKVGYFDSKRSLVIIRTTILSTITTFLVTLCLTDSFPTQVSYSCYIEQPCSSSSGKVGPSDGP